MRESKSEALAAIVGGSSELETVLARAAAVAPTSVPVLVTGESGTGKELLARALHELGPNPRGPFVAVNCGALARELAESELFGHERGAFTGAAGRRTGWFEEAAGGTLVLDEIGELPLELQPKLLRVLETGRLRRVGGAGEVAVRVRVVAMTLRNLEGETQRGTFRADLFYRLAGFELALPPLRRRRTDIPLLAEHFLREIAPEVGPRVLDPAAIAALAAAEWPGNIRQLRNVMRRAAILTVDRIETANLDLPAPPRFRIADEPLLVRLHDVDQTPAPAPAPALAAAPSPFSPADVGSDDQLSLPNRTFEEIEKAVLVWALRRNAGSRRRAAKSLSVARSTFCDKVRKYGLAPGNA
ncbi:MAG TPA: sigma-54 dependent transcriptional regulator [Polyangia bacterium]|jgi:two-component system nitrogen regulation response regulator GlnG|nr:sigma-54 dependent transcriptional regulator [Polyangia bacterium]